VLRIPAGRPGARPASCSLSCHSLRAAASSGRASATPTRIGPPASRPNRVRTSPGLIQAGHAAAVLPVAVILLVLMLLMIRRSMIAGAWLICPPLS
jgi:hypothetical protein